MGTYLLIITAWIVVGLILGDRSLKECVSLEWDDATMGATILFPLSALFFGEGIVCPAFFFWSSHWFGARAVYRGLVVVFWPFKIVWSVLGFLFVLAIRMFVGSLPTKV